MNRVAAEVAQKILVLLEHDDVDARTRQQEAKHHPGRPAARDATGGMDGFGGHCSPSYPPLEGEGRRAFALAQCELGWGDSRSEAGHPTPTAFTALRRSTLPLQGRVSCYATPPPAN